MARTIHRLSALKATRAKTAGMLADGGGLYLQVGKPSEQGRAPPKSWIFRYKREKAGTKKVAETWMGLGSAGDVTLEEARETAAECRRQLREGIDPLAARKAASNAANVAAAHSVTFMECSERYISAHKPAWKNAKHQSQWQNTLATYAEPIMGSLPVLAIGTGDVLKVLEPIWATKPETASRVRGRIEAVLDWATARGYRHGENPARWRGHLMKLLPARAKVRKVEHHPALPYSELPAFMADLRAQEATAARALEFLILTVARTGEVIGATWSEIDAKAKTWTVPGERMKAGKPHRAPLSARALELIENQQKIGGEYVFPGGKAKRPLSNMAMLKLLERMERGELTVHGFRSTFRDWAAERTNYPREVAEMALAHTIGDKVEAAYRRGDLFEKRRRLMEEWAKFCGTVKTGSRDKVVSLAGRR